MLPTTIGVNSRASQLPNVVKIAAVALSLNSQIFNIARPKTAEVEHHASCGGISRSSGDGGVVAWLPIVGVQVHELAASLRGAVEPEDLTALLRGVEPEE